MSWTNQHDRGSEWEEETVEHYMYEWNTIEDLCRLDFYTGTLDRTQSKSGGS